MTDGQLDLFAVVPLDEAARQRVRHELNDTLFVEAGAGSGKTSALVGRVVELVISGVEMRHIAAITFTDKAALELRDRIRKELEERAHSSTAALEAERCREALDQVDAAAISTLHAFAQRILSEHSVDAGLPPSIEVLDEISSQVAFDQRWRDFLDQLLDEPEHGDLLLLADTLGIKLDEHLRDVAEVFADNWDLLADSVGEAERPGRPRVDSIVDIISSVLDMAQHCTDPDDKLIEPIERLAAWGQALSSASDWLDTVCLLRNPGVTGASRGRAANWPDVAAVRDTIKAALAEAEAELARMGDRTIRSLANVIKEFTLEHVEERRATGRLEFHDLLVLARQMMRDQATGYSVRSSLAARYRRLLLDEFQDTDPIQIELAVLIASDDPDAGQQPWPDIAVQPGRLFFVGDPKQSIYRFRRADVALFLQARSSFATEPVRLDTNFRTVGPIIEWINGVFAELIQFEPGRQPDYQPLHSWRAPHPDAPHPVTVLGAEPHSEGSAEDLRHAEAADVAAIVRAALADEWLVNDGGDAWRPCRPGDITILLPARTSLPALERALEREGIDYRAETSSLVWSTAEIRELMAILRAIDDPSDELSIATALRSAAYGCGDDDLYRWKRVFRGSWNHQHDLPASAPFDDPVRLAMAHLGELHRSRTWTTPSALVERIIRDRRLLELGVVRGRPRDVWRRLRFVQDQARAYVDSEGGSLRQFLAWAHLQSAEGSRVAETLLPETDADAVRIMTVHGSKGLEFPITILAEAADQGSRSGSPTTAMWSSSWARISPPTAMTHSNPSTNRWATSSDCGCCTSQQREPATTSLCPCIGPRPRARGLTQAHRTTASQQHNCCTVAPKPRVCRTRRSQHRHRRSPRFDSSFQQQQPRSSIEASGPTSARQCSREAQRRPRLAPPRLLAGPKRPSDSPSIQASTRPHATSTCHRGTRAVMAPQSVGPSTLCCKASTLLPAKASTALSRRRPQPRVSSATRTSSATSLDQPSRARSCERQPSHPCGAKPMWPLRSLTLLWSRVTSICCTGALTAWSSSTTRPMRSPPMLTSSSAWASTNSKARPMPWP